VQVQLPYFPCIEANPTDENIDWRVAMNALFYRLSVLHKRLDDEIRCELKRRIPDTMRLLRLKKLKLSVKDRLHVETLTSRRV
jgi:hypothetical protein